MKKKIIMKEFFKCCQQQATKIGAGRTLRVARIELLTRREEGSL
jgi:hypothetical protein